LPGASGVMSVATSTEISPLTIAGLPRLRVATGGDVPGVDPAVKISSR
jgi:hypothetical protein